MSGRFCRLIPVEFAAWILGDKSCFGLNWCWCAKEDLIQIMDSLAQEPAGELAQDAAEAAAETAVDAPVQAATVYTSESPAIRKLANAILAKAVKLDADALFLEPGPDALMLGYRSADGSQQLEPPLPLSVAAPLTQRFKQLLGLNPELLPAIQTRELKARMRRRGFVFSFSFVPVCQGEVIGIQVREVGKRCFGQFAAQEAGTSTDNRPGSWGSIKQALTRFSRTDRLDRKG